MFREEYVELCRWLVRDLEERALWNDEIRRAILSSQGVSLRCVAGNNSFPAGSIQGISDIPDDLKRIYRTAWEIDPLAVIDLAADRGPFIDQSQSMTVHFATSSPSTMVSALCLGQFKVTTLLSDWTSNARVEARFEDWSVLRHYARPTVTSATQNRAYAHCIS